MWFINYIRAFVLVIRIEFRSEFRPSSHSWIVNNVIVTLFFIIFNYIFVMLPFHDVHCCCGAVQLAGCWIRVKALAAQHTTINNRVHTCFTNIYTRILLTYVNIGRCMQLARHPRQFRMKHICNNVVRSVVRLRKFAASLRIQFYLYPRVDKQSRKLNESMV